MAMSNDTNVIVRDPETRQKPKVEKPKMYKVILVNDDFTPFEIVVAVLQTVFHMGPERAFQVMVTAHQKGSCVISVYTRDVAETKAAEGIEMGRKHGCPLAFTVEPEE